MTAHSIVAHLFFLHDLRPEWSHQINAPLWTIAAEVQIYLLFPALFWAMRRLNPFVVAVGFVVVEYHWLEPLIGPHFPGAPVYLARWFVGGCLLAEITARGWRIPARLTLPLGLAALLVAMAQLRFFPWSDYRHDAIWFVAFALLLLAAVRHPESRRNPMVWRPLRWLGMRSFSIYAFHWPVFLVVLYIAQQLGLTGWGAAVFTVGTGVPVALAVVVVAFRFVEGPSLKRVAAVR